MQLFTTFFFSNLSRFAGKSLITERYLCHGNPVFNFPCISYIIYRTTQTTTTNNTKFTLYSLQPSSFLIKCPFTRHFSAVYMQQPKALVASEGSHDQHSYEHNSYEIGDNTGIYAVDEYMDVVDIWDFIMWPQYINTYKLNLNMAIAARSNLHDEF